MSPHEQLAVRQEVLVRLGGSAAAVQQVLRYGNNRFDRTKLPGAPVLPMPDELHLDDWRAYAAQQGGDTFRALQERLPQLCIPIREGMSHTPAYDEVIRRGRPFRAEAFGGTLSLEHPEALRLVICEHAAGALPVCVTPHRADFETLNQALAFRNEPVAINASVNAHTIAGLINWDRVRRYQVRWLAQQGNTPGANWGQEMRRVATTEKARFYDRLMLVCEHPYSGLSAQQLGLDLAEDVWLQRSTVLRLEHEFTHYATMRLYNYMSLNLFDETLCDWAGMTAALGRFESRWFLQFLGLEAWPQVRQDGRVHSYRQDLDDEAFALQCHLMVRLAAGVEALSQQYYTEHERMVFLLALAQLTLELLASEDRDRFFLPAYEEARRLMGLV